MWFCFAALHGKSVAVHNSSVVGWFKAGGWLGIDKQTVCEKGYCIFKAFWLIVFNCATQQAVIRLQLHRALKAPALVLRSPIFFFLSTNIFFLGGGDLNPWFFFFQMNHEWVCKWANEKLTPEASRVDCLQGPLCSDGLWGDQTVTLGSGENPDGCAAC